MLRSPNDLQSDTFASTPDFDGSYMVNWSKTKVLVPKFFLIILCILHKQFQNIYKTKNYNPYFFVSNFSVQKLCINIIYNF